MGPRIQRVTVYTAITLGNRYASVQLETALNQRIVQSISKCDICIDGQLYDTVNLIETLNSSGAEAEYSSSHFY